VSYLLIYLFINTDTHSIANSRKQNFFGHRRLLLHNVNVWWWWTSSHHRNLTDCHYRWVTGEHSYWVFL